MRVLTSVFHQSAEDTIAEQAKQQEDDPYANLSKKEKKKKKKQVSTICWCYDAVARRTQVIICLLGASVWSEHVLPVLVWGFIQTHLDWLTSEWLNVSVIQLMVQEINLLICGLFSFSSFRLKSVHEVLHGSVWPKKCQTDLIILSGLFSITFLGLRLFAGCCRWSTSVRWPVFVHRMPWREIFPFPRLSCPPDRQCLRTPLISRLHAFKNVFNELHSVLLLRKF